MSFTQSFASTAAAVVGLGDDLSVLSGLPDDALLAAHSLILDHQRHSEMYTAWFSAEIARRSPKEGGYSGLAQRNGFSSAEGFLQSLSPITRAEAVQFVEAGALMNSAEADAGATLWESALATALRCGELRVASVEAIRRGLAPASDSAPAADLLAECKKLIARAEVTSLDELAREARSARDRLDEAGIARCEKQRHDSRYFKRWVRTDGMYQGSFLLDPEGGQAVFAALDAIASPRRTPRFRESGRSPVGTSLDGTSLDETRTTDHRLADGFVEIARLAVEVDPGKLFGGTRPAVRVIVTEEALASDSGHGYFEGDSQPISRETVDRFICDAGIVGIKFNRERQVVDLARTQRLFSSNQRLMLSVRDGGCLFPDCTRPPAQCEAHHINQWDRDRGLTNVEDGVLLCKHHHMLLHNNHWNIIRKGSDYWLRPPVAEEPHQRLRQLHSKSPLIQELAARAAT